MGSQVWWCTPLMPTFVRQRQVVLREFGASQGNIVSESLLSKKNNKNKTRNATEAQ